MDAANDNVGSDRFVLKLVECMIADGEVEEAWLYANEHFSDGALSQEGLEGVHAKVDAARAEKTRKRADKRAPRVSVMSGGRRYMRRGLSVVRS